MLTASLLFFLPCLVFTFDSHMSFTACLRAYDSCTKLAKILLWTTFFSRTPRINHLVSECCIRSVVIMTIWFLFADGCWPYFHGWQEPDLRTSNQGQKLYYRLRKAFRKGGGSPQWLKRIHTEDISFTTSSKCQLWEDYNSVINHTQVG